MTDVEHDLAVDPTAFVAAFGTDPEITASNEATVHLEDSAPAQIGTAGTPNVVAAPTLSAFHVESIAVRCIVDAAWALRAPAIAYTTGVSW